MPYTKIVFVKLFVNLFTEDERFLYLLNESQQLLYIKFLYLAAITNNKIPNNIKYISDKINYQHDENCLNSDLKRIMDVFPKFKFINGFYYFEKFHELHNFKIRKSKGNPKEFQRSSKGVRKVGLEKEKEKEKEEEKEEEKEKEIKALSCKHDLVAPLLYLNEKTGKSFTFKNRSTLNLIKARFNEGRTLDDFKKVIDRKCEQWKNDSKMMDYLRPSTLFNLTNFENYLNEKDNHNDIPESLRHLIAK